MDQRILKLTLWYQLLRNGMYGKLVRFYGTIWIVSAGLVVISLTMLSQQTVKASSTHDPILGWILACVALICFGYGIGKVYGSLTVNILSVVMPAITLAGGEHTGFLNWVAFVKGAGACFGLVVFTFLVYSIAPLPYFVVGYRGWPHRRAITLVLIITGVVGLELLRLALGLMADLRPPWLTDVASFMVEPAWPHAICLWIWLNIAYILSNYDSELLPPLLRRIGLPGVPDQLSLDDAYMIDYLLVELPERPEL